MKAEAAVSSPTAGSSDDVSSNPEPEYTVSDAIDQLGFGLFQFKLLIMCGMCWCVDAMEAMLLSFLIPKLKSVWSLGSGLDATIGAVVFAGMFVGAFVWGPVSDVYGRRRGYILVVGLVGGFGMCSAVAPNIIALLIFRFGVGVGIGGANIPYSLFAEFLPTQSRGAGMLINQMWWSVGTVLECGLAWLTLGRDSDSDSDNAWRYLLIYSTLPVVALYPFVWWLPESPRFCIVHGRTADALAILKRLARDNARPLPPGTLVAKKSNPSRHQTMPVTTTTAIAVVPAAAVPAPTAALATPHAVVVNGSDDRHSPTQPLLASQPAAPQYNSDVFRSNQSVQSPAPDPVKPKPPPLPFQALGELLAPPLRHTTLVTWTIWSVATFAYYGVSFLTPRVFNADPYRMALFSALFEFPGLVLPIFVINKFGRKHTLMAMLAACGIACGVLALPQYPSGGVPAQYMLLFFARMCVAGAFAVVYVYTTELYPSSCRASGLCTAGAMSRLAGIATTYISTDLSTSVCLLLYAIACVGAIIAVASIRVETSSSSLSDVASGDAEEETGGH